MSKKVTLLIVNSSANEAFEVEGLKITRSFKEELTMPMEKANKIVAAIGGIEAITVSVVPDSLQDAPKGFGQEELQEAKSQLAKLESEAITQAATINDQQAVIEKQAKTIEELQALLDAKAPVEAKEAQAEAKEEVKAESDTATQAPAKATTKKTAK